ncbi:DUF1844 domain-containing protein [Haliovirga abyssi]|uniref:DUF1844 domain-containing protein n=1 Tax=Haliovirga abyssi TaxID=2996794 RepID=A0AAU9DNW3_9FUSO|nr:DUF1844 domain-containing protein [Haliovirga abyssi]BDU50068.1 hypothetical protein HLVA_06370 [Haliovirga abyssi]
MENLFLGLVYSLQMQTMMSLGKLANPVSGKIEKNLEIAKMNIDMLEMLEEKTKGNLTDEESKFITNLLTDLRLNYVEEIKTKDKDENEDKESEKKDEQIEEK